MYAFGLLGAFVFSSLSLDVIRWRLGRRDLAFWIGVLTTVMILVAWCINLVEKELATVFGGALTLFGMIVAVGVRRSWFLDLLHKIPWVERLQARAYQASEALVDDELKGLVTLADAVEIKVLYSSSTLMALRGENSRLCKKAFAAPKALANPRFIACMSRNGPDYFTATRPIGPTKKGCEPCAPPYRKCARK